MKKYKNFNNWLGDLRKIAHEKYSYSKEEINFFFTKKEFQNDFDEGRSPREAMELFESFVKDAYVDHFQKIKLTD